jgi:outer membrane cobalamin receptor
LYKNKISCNINQTYTGYRFTSTDNTSWLNPYDLLNVRFSYLHQLKHFSIECFGAINNFLNKDYQVVAMRPMMKRNFEMGIALNFKKNKL